jgi:hypothetical protein
MTPADWFALIAGLALFTAVGNVSILVQERRGRSQRKRRNTAILRTLAVVSTLVVLGTIGFVRPWYWAVALGVIALVALFGVFASLRRLWRDASAPLGRTIVSASMAVFFGGFLLALGGIAGVVDGAALSSRHAEPTFHGGVVLSRPVLYQVFWGAAWSVRPTPPAVVQAVAFETDLAHSAWVKSVVDSGFGVRSIIGGGCWIDATPLGQSLKKGVDVSSTATGPYPSEVAAVVDHRHALTPCPGSVATAFPATLPKDAVLAVWLPPEVTYALGGLSAHGTLSLPRYRYGLVVAGLSGSYAYWGLPECRAVLACRLLPSFAPPSYSLSHEFLESITNPYAHSWYADAPLSWSARYVLADGPFFFFNQRPSFEGEVADLCEPAQPDADGRILVGRESPRGPPVAAFYRPGVGCVT